MTALAVAGPDETLTLTVDAFLQALIGRNRSPATIRAYRTDLTQFLTWLVENNGVISHPAAITRADIQAYLTALGQQRLAGVSRARKLAAIREYLRFLVEHDVIPRSPAAGMAAPRREQKSRVFLRPDEYTRLLSLAGSHPRDFAILQVFLQTGIRVSELVRLTRDDIDLVGHTLTVRAGKGQADRVIDLEKKAMQALKRWLDVRPKVTWEELFLNYEGEPISERSVRRLVAKYRVGAALTKPATPHSLRHTFASYKVENGVSLKQVQEWLGHKNLNTTQLYVHLSRQSARKAMEQTSL